MISSGSDLIGKDFQKSALAFDNRRRAGEAELGQHRRLDAAACGDPGDDAFHLAAGLIVFHGAARVHAGDAEGMENLPVVQAQQPCRRRHRAEGRADAVAVKAALAR